VLLALTPGAQLIVFEPNDKEFKQIASYKVSENETHAYPIASGNRTSSSKTRTRSRSGQSIEFIREGDRSKASEGSPSRFHWSCRKDDHSEQQNRHIGSFCSTRFATEVSGKEAIWRFETSPGHRQQRPATG
jgi:hypothetical protein